MSIKDDFKPYETIDGYLCNEIIPPATVRGCDNEPMFTSEYYIMLNRNGAITPQDVRNYTILLDNCVSGSYLNRAPGDATTGNPDNHVGVYAGLVEFGIKPMFKFPLSLLRQPQLLFAHLCASGTSKWYKPWQWPLALYASVSILISCINKPANDTDLRRLSWLLIQATKSNLLCRLASGVWFKRLHKDYANGMKDVNGIYFLPTNNNPYQNWVKE